MPLETRTEHVLLEADFTATVRTGRTHADLDALVRSRLHALAFSVTSRLQPVFVRQAQDEINGLLGQPKDCPDGFYRDLVGNVQLHLPDEVAADLAKQREDAARLRRLRFLKENIFSDPSFVAIELFERNPVGGPELDSLLKRASEMALKLRSFDDWWAPLLLAWGDLAQKMQSPAEADVAMRVLLRAISDLDSSLIRNYPVPRPEAGGPN
ncbi:hypothetical protein AB0C44_04545 [Micromonospora taraxaci]|uniref:hypothetical protein n=1 Tax=Micromonospora taraxaci TaxID=1316803 RepID=UPI0033D7A4EB